LAPSPADRSMPRMTISMRDDCITNINELAALVEAAEALPEGKVERRDGIDAVYAWMNDLLIRLKYRNLRKRDKGIMRRYLALYSGYGESHVDHLIAAYMEHGKIARKQRTQPQFPVRYTKEDVALLATVADAYEHQNGRALKEVCREMYELHQDARFVRLSAISVSRLYDLKKTDVFRKTALSYTKTRPVAVPIGERRKPYPAGKPGYLRVDSVHQGDRDKEKGVYHVNLVDEVTQWEIVVSVEGISEHFLLPALEEALAAFPFRILGFHSDNGSEYINRTVAALLQKLLIDQTKSRSRRTNDNALVEGKNGAVVRKHMGHGHIPRRHAPRIMDFYREHFNPFVNFHRFSAFPDEETDAKGKIRKIYRTYMTPCEKLLSIDGAERYFKEGVTRESLGAEARKLTHLASAEAMQKAKVELFTSISRRGAL